MEYIVLYGATTKDLANNVNSYLFNGWQLYGNLVFSEKGGLYQALIKIEK